MTPADRAVLAAWLTNPEGYTHAYATGEVAPAVRRLMARVGSSVSGDPFTALDRAIVEQWVRDSQDMGGGVCYAVERLLAGYDVRGRLNEALCERIAAAAEVIGRRAYRENKHGNLDAAANP